MKKLLILAILIFVAPKANASESVPKINYPTNGDCLVTIFRSTIGRNQDQNFLDAIQEKLEQGYKATSGIKVSKTYTDGSQSIYIDLFKPDCGASPYMKWFLWSLLPIGIGIAGILAFKFRGSFRSRVHSKV